MSSDETQVFNTAQNPFAFLLSFVAVDDQTRKLFLSQVSRYVIGFPLRLGENYRLESKQKGLFVNTIALKTVQSLLILYCLSDVQLHEEVVRVWSLCHTR